MFPIVFPSVVKLDAGGYGLVKKQNSNEATTANTAKMMNKTDYEPLFLNVKPAIIPPNT